MKKLMAVLASGLMFTGVVNAQSGAPMKTDGTGFTFSLDVPTGWVSDAKATEGQHLKGLMLPIGQKWETAGSRIYTSVVDLNVAKGETVKDVVKYDKQIYQTEAKATVTEMEPIALGQGQTARIIKIEGAGDGYQAIAYIGEHKAVPYVVLSSTSKEAFEKDLATFKQVVSTYSIADHAAVAHD